MKFKWRGHEIQRSEMVQKIHLIFDKSCKILGVLSIFKQSFHGHVKLKEKRLFKGY
jgi:hypothetical protein